VTTLGAITVYNALPPSSPKKGAQYFFSVISCSYNTTNEQYGIIDSQSQPHMAGKAEFLLLLLYDKK